MALKSRKGIYFDRPLLTEQELDFIMHCTSEYPVFADKDALLKDSCLEKLHKSKRRISMIKFK